MPIALCLVPVGPRLPCGFLSRAESGIVIKQAMRLPSLHQFLVTFAFFSEYLLGQDLEHFPLEGHQPTIVDEFRLAKRL